jgi:hypothetical protein
VVPSSTGEIVDVHAASTHAMIAHVSPVLARRINQCSWARQDDTRRNWLGLAPDFARLGSVSLSATLPTAHADRVAGSMLGSVFAARALKNGRRLAAGLAFALTIPNSVFAAEFSLAALMGD